MVNDKFATDIKTIVRIFNKSFAEQCNFLKKERVLPANQIFLTQSWLSSLHFNEDGILKIRALNIYKTHGYDDISIRMIKLCDKSLKKLLVILFKNSTNATSYYPSIWKRSNIIPVHKNNDKQNIWKNHL